MNILATNFKNIQLQKRYSLLSRMINVKPKNDRANTIFLQNYQP
jgi:hypothetical protein